MQMILIPTSPCEAGKSPTHLACFAKAILIFIFRSSPTKKAASAVFFIAPKVLSVKNIFA